MNLQKFPAQLIRKQALEVFNQNFDRLSSLIPEPAQTVLRQSLPNEELKEDIVSLRKGLELVQRQNEQLRKNNQDLQRRMNENQRKLMSLNRSIDANRDFINQEKQKVDQAYSDINSLLYSRFQKVENQLKDSFAAEQSTLDQYQLQITALKDHVQMKLNDQSENRLSLQTHSISLQKLRQNVTELTHRELQLQQEFKLIESKVPLLPKIFSLEQENQNKIFQLQNYLDLYLPGYIQAQLSETLMCFIEPVQRIKLSIYQTKRFQDITQQLLTHNGKGDLARRTLNFRKMIQTIKIRNKKVLQDKLTAEDLKNLTSNINRVDDDLVSRNKQNEQVRRIVTQIQSRVNKKISQSYQKINSEKMQLEQTLNLIRREGQFNHSKYFDRCFDLQQKFIKSAVDSQLKNQDLRKAFLGVKNDKQKLMELQNVITDHSNILAHLKQLEPIRLSLDRETDNAITNRLIQSSQRLNRLRVQEDRRHGSVSRGESNSTIIKGVLLRSMHNRRRPFKDKSSKL